MRPVFFLLVLLIVLTLPNNIYSFEFYELDNPPWNISLINSSSITPSDEKIIVAVIDTGLDLNHPDFQMRIWNNNDEISSNGLDDDKNGYVDDINGWNFVSDTNNVMDDSLVSHGTHVSGTLVSPEVGVAPENIIIMPLKAFDKQGDAEFIAVANAIRYAVDNGARIISMSLGGTSGQSDLFNSILYAQSNDVMMVAAVGNEAHGAIDYPAKYSEVIAVGSVDRNMKRSSFSNYGAEMEVVSPGEDINSTVLLNKGLASKLKYNSTIIPSYPMEFSNKTNENLDFVIVDGGKGTVPELEKLDLADKLVLIERGSLTFKEMAQNVKNLNGSGIIVYNNDGGLFGGTLQSKVGVYALSVSLKSGFEIKTGIEQGNNSIILDISPSNYSLNSGTSMATPHVSAMLALMMTYNNTLSTETYRELLHYGTLDLGSPNFDNGFGYGLIQGDLIKEILDDKNKPIIDYGITNKYTSTSGKMSFDLALDIMDNNNVAGFTYNYTSGNLTREFRINNPTKGNMSTAVGIEIPAEENYVDITITAEDVIGNTNFVHITFERVGSVLSESKTSSFQTNISDTTGGMQWGIFGLAIISIIATRLHNRKLKMR